MRAPQSLKTIGCIAVSLLLLIAQLTAARLDAPADKVYRIMPVGDSITEGGQNFTGYRYPLWKKLSDAGYHIEFVGSRTSPSPTGRLAHEGYSGKNAEFLASIVPEHFKERPADIVLIHAGHNHSAEEHPVEKIVAATESMIDAFRTTNPRVIVLLAQVIPSGKLPKYDYIPELNAALAKLAKRLDTPEQPVVIVDQATGFDPGSDTIEDKVHPNEHGAQKMAARWFDALIRVLPGNGH